MAIVVELADDSESDVITAWATIEQVSAITGVPESDISDGLIFQAQCIIDMVTGRTIQMYELLLRNLHKRDLYFLQLALAYQVVWMMAQPDLYQRFDLTSTNDERGVNSNFVAGATTLAPLAKRAIRRLSWKGTRSLRFDPRWVENNHLMPAGAPIIDNDYEFFRQI